MVLLFILLGGFREMFFLNLNEQIFFNEGGTERYRVLETFHFLGDFDTDSLYAFKWIGTLLFSAIFLGLSVFTLDRMLGRPDLVRWLVGLYILGIGLGGICFLGGRFSGQPDLGYTIARAIMGALQSPFPMMLMIPALFSTRP